MGELLRATTTMSDGENFEIETTDAGASATVSVEAGQIRKGGYIMIKGKPCKVKDVSVSKTGKHGHAKCKFAASDIFTGNTCEELCPSTHSIDVPVVKKKDWSITGLDGEYVLPKVAYKTDDDQKCSDLIEELVAKVDEGAEIEIFCTVLSAVGQEKITEVRKKDA